MRKTMGMLVENDYKSLIFKQVYYLINRFVIGVLYLKAKLWFDPNFNKKNNIKSSLKIDIVIPVIERDLEILDLVIDSINTYILHDIDNIYVVAPNTESIRDFCRAKKCLFIDEDAVLPIKKNDINYSVNWVDRSWWIYQQLLKYWMKNIVQQEWFLITESEAVFLQNRKFEHKGRIILPVASAPPHTPYFQSIKKLFWKEPPMILNFTSHHSLFSKKILNNLINDIEKKHNLPRYTAILEILDENELSTISDYETYGQYFYYNYKKNIVLEHRLNKDIKRQIGKKNILQQEKYRKKYKVLSFSRYLN